MKTKVLLMALATLITLNFTMAQTVFQTESASIDPTEIYATEDSDLFTIITWNDATELTSVELEVWGYIFELEENLDYVITQIDDFTSLFEFIEEEEFKKKVGMEKFDDPWYFTFHFDQGAHAILTIYPEMEVQYGVIFSVSDHLGNPIDDAVITFDDYSFNPGEYDLGFYYSGYYEYSIVKEGFETIEGEIIIDESAISEHFVMYPTAVYSQVAFHIVSNGISVQQAEIVIDGLYEPIHSDYQGQAFVVLASGVYTYTVTAEGYESQQGQFELQETNMDIYLDLAVAMNTDINRELGINAFPNPASDLINISLVPGNINYIEVFSVDGKLVHSQVSEQLSLALDLKQYKQGLYFIKIQSGDIMQSLRFVKK